MIRHYWIIFIMLSGGVFAQNLFFAKPWRERSIIISEEGIYPNKILMFEGETLKLFVTSVSENPSCLKVSDTQIYLKALKGQISEGEWHFDRSGTYSMHCPGQNFRGTIVIIGQKAKRGRTIQSINDNLQNEWYPKEN